MPTFREDIHLGHKTTMVETDDLANGSVTHDKMADDSVGENNIIDGSVTTPKIANEAVTTPKIADEAVTTTKIEDGSVTNPKLADDAVQTRNIKDRNVTSLKIEKNAVLPEHVSKASFREMAKDLQNQIDALQIHGLAVSNEFGTNQRIGVSQKTLTEAINKIWDKFEEITGEVLQGFNMVITPEYYIGETGADVHISANTVEANGIFEHIAFYGNGQLITEASNVDYFEYDFHIDETTVIQCVAKIMGIEYNRQGIITHYSSFLLGSGDTYADLMDGNNRFLPQYVIPITNGMRGAYDVDVAEGKRIIVVVGSSLSEGFIRADLNGVEIQFTESTCTDADGKTYKVFTSEPWSAGTYNIDVNG